MKKTIFTGSAVAINTPMYPDGKVNYEELKKLVDFQINNGTDSIVVCGTTGESATLSDDEHVQVIKAFIRLLAFQGSQGPWGGRPSPCNPLL